MRSDVVFAVECPLSDLMCGSKKKLVAYSVIITTKYHVRV